MWLINAKTFDLEQFPSYDTGDEEIVATNKSRPKYSILSHRWQADEVSFQDIQNLALRQTKQGFQKIVQCCQRSLRDGLEYTWIDTCCINKDSDAELSESINSMYRWYRDAEICYAFLYDVSSGESESFQRSEWFSRGWTLQEFVAPRYLVFYDCAWTLLGDRQALHRKLSDRTKIDLSFLASGGRLQDLSIAERMSWAAGRVTTRPEDRAYSLLGIFQVSMPMLYGEGAERAFRRLQEEIIKHSDDHSIFAWSMSEEPNNHGLLARNPAAFASRANVHCVSARSGRRPYSVTNRGVSITLQMVPWCMDTYLAVLNCATRDENTEREHDTGQVGIYLRRLYEDDTYVRVRLDGEELVHDLHSRLGSHKRSIARLFRDVLINVRQSELSLQDKHFISDKVYGFRLSERLLGWDLKASKSSKLYCRGTSQVRGTTHWNQAERILFKKPGSEECWFFATLDISLQSRNLRLMNLFLDYDFNPICSLSDRAAIDFGSNTIPQTVKALPKFEESHALRTIYRNEIRYVRAQDGHWKVRGDRIEGLDVRLAGTGFEGPPTHLTIRRGESAQGAVWDVDIDDVARPGLLENIQRLTGITNRPV